MCECVREESQIVPLSTFDQRELKKSRIRETSNLSTDADCRTDKILESLRDLSRRKKMLIFFLQNTLETTLPDGLETSGRRVYH